MIPLTVAEEIKETLLDYLLTTFNFQDQAVEQALRRFLTAEKTGLFKGPYLNLRLPYQPVDPAEPLPLDIRPPFTPHLHQFQSFQRLTSHSDHTPQPTLITTGTGSGKTECFLYPILDHCYRHRRQPGVKAIILYPMNALAADQAGRLANILWRNPRLKNQVTAGMYVGGSGQTHTVTGPDHLVTDRDTLRKHPPDILLTNYKMLDFLLLRPEDKPLWALNTPTTLRYLVLDELHTYDGAQGSDVACLIRRLMARLQTPPDTLCPVGTSATVGHNTPDSRQQLIDFAGQIFGVPFSEAAIIGETRQTLVEFLATGAGGVPGEAVYDQLPTDLAALAGQAGESYDSYIERQIRLWFEQPLQPVQLGQALLRHSLLRYLLSTTGDAILPWPDVVQQLARFDPQLAEYPDRSLLLQSFLALIAHARRPAGAGAELESDETPVSLRPFLTVQVQLWIREMSRLLRTVSAAPQFFWYDEALDPENGYGLPPYYCRDCGHTGWLTFIAEGDSRLADTVPEIYQRNIKRHKNMRYVYPNPGHHSGAAGRSPHLPGTQTRVCPACLVIRFGEQCPVCDVPTLPLIIHHETSNPDRGQPQDLQRCPACGTDNALSIVGSQAASLSSVAISHLFATPLNTDKKLLAFTDSVQDAAHRAAFFGARTYRFGLRTAFQAALPDDTPIRLTDFADRVLDHWQQQWQNNQKLVATFMPPDLRQMPDYRQFINQGSQTIPASLNRSLRRRLLWEISMEYGFNARLGRSLEKVGSSTAVTEPAALDRAIDRLALVLPEEIGSLHAVITRPALRHFVQGLLDRTRLRGGVDHPLLQRYLHNQGLWYMLTKEIEPLLSPFHKRSRLPKFLTDRAERGVFDLFISRGRQLTWYVDWAQRVLAGALPVSDINDLYRLTIATLTELGLLHSVNSGKATAYGLNPAHLLLTTQTAGLRCNICGHRHTISGRVRAAWLGQPCLAYRCAGRYQAEADFGQHYYRALYQRGQVERIFSREHTGLLTRDTREDTEAQFKMQQAADAANLLTATPTLEMGIDVGDLSATMACAVPPAPANYLQRIGRAGRETGNSLILALANTRPHDLYFFEEPLEMIAGAITPPGCYLDAPDMLKRQFLAFCMSHWIVNDQRVRLLPHDVRGLLARYQKGGFPEDFLAYYGGHQAALIEAFLDLFKPDISPATTQRLRDFAGNNRLPAAVRQAIEATSAERERLRKARRRLKKRRTKIEADMAQYQEPEEEIKKIDREMKLIVSLIKTLEDKYILNFFTDASLLPNYAFPETGVRLNAVITGLEPDEESGKSYQVKEYLRAAQVALRELAPFNRFYAESRKLPINFVEIGSADEAIERWQFCDRCAYMELVQASHYKKTCPQCGSAMWSDKGQQHQMLRLQQVTARTDHYDSLVGDDADERERAFYQTSLYLKSQRRVDSGPAHIISALPFGLEYIDHATLREINFGLTETIGRQITINGEERFEEGFKLCRDCGLAVSAQQEYDDKERAQHSSRCLTRLSQREPVWEQIYLYRELSSEALRLLLPVSTMFVEEKLATLTAAIHLGLKRYLRGSADHLHIMSHSEPASDDHRRHYLVIYDTVPGGTSLLRDLARPEKFMVMLQETLAVLKSCACRDEPAKKACYRCLYNYRHQYRLSAIDRQVAVDMLTDILARWDDLEPIPSLSEADLDDLIESELEQRFIEALAEWARQQGGRWQQTVQHGKKAWELGLDSSSWLVEPQVTLDHNHGVWPASRPDFIFWPRTNKTARPVAVFTDGFAYHVTPHKAVGRLGDDVQKRQAIIRSGQFVVWSLGWDDVKALEGADKLKPDRFLLNGAQSTVKKLLGSQNKLPVKIVTAHTAIQLLAYLRHPEHEQWTELAMALAISLLDIKRPPAPLPVLEALAAQLKQESAPPDLSLPDQTASGNCLYHIAEQRHLQLLALVPLAALRPPQPDRFQLLLRLHDTQAQRASDSFEASWQQFWQMINLWQFLPGFVPLTTESVLHAAPKMDVPAQPPEPPALSEAWQEALDFADPACEALLQACLGRNCPPPVVGYELPNAAGRVAAQAELAWPPHKLAVLLPDDPTGAPVFKAAGWYVFEPADQETVIAHLEGSA